MPRRGWKVGRAEARCPFYRKDTLLTISCEGLVGDSSIVQNFGRREDALIQLRTFCCRRYENCEIYQAIMKAKYQEE